MILKALIRRTHSQRMMAKERFNELYDLVRNVCYHTTTVVLAQVESDI